MSDIIYTYQGQVYANITNKCNCRCTFCIRNNQDTVGEARTLWHTSEPNLKEITTAIDHFNFSSYSELVFCGYGEPTCALDRLLESARYAKAHNKLSIRLNTNGLGSLYHKKNIVPLLAEVVDTISISLNAPSAEQYNEVTRPFNNNAFDCLLQFAYECKLQIPSVKLTVVDILSPEDIAASQQIADTIGIPLRIRTYDT
ncbi:MAG: TIGR04100 family radical SAM protein [Lachnospiraceae bacterium]